jgi:DNA polymerase-1
MALTHAAHCGSQEPLTAEERQLGKKVNFSIVYGAGARQLAAELGISQQQAKQFMDR